MEVILMAALREVVEQLLAAAAKARLDVAGITVEPKALLDCFGNIYRRKSDAEATHCFVDIGCSTSRSIVARGSQMLFARVLPIGSEHFTQAVATELNIPLAEARRLRHADAAKTIAAPERRDRQAVMHCAISDRGDGGSPVSCVENHGRAAHATMTQIAKTKKPRRKTAWPVAEHLPRFSCFASRKKRGHGPQAAIQLARGALAAPSVCRFTLGLGDEIVKRPHSGQRPGVARRS